MKKYAFLPVIVLVMCSLSCNNSASDNKKAGRTKADTLYDEVMDGHDVGMSKMGMLSRLQQQVSHLIDSIDKLPAKAKEMAAPYRTKLDGLLVDLKEADSSMNKWMEGFNLDSAMNDTKERINYLTDQRDKVAKVKGAILSSLQKADSVLKKTF